MRTLGILSGRNEDALIMARKLVEIQSKWYPFADYNSLMESGNKSKDRVFSTEVLFGLENKKRGEIFTNYFTPRIPYSKYVLASHYHNSSCAHYDTFDDNKHTHVYMDKEYLRE